MRLKAEQSEHQVTFPVPSAAADSMDIGDQVSGQTNVEIENRNDDSGASCGR
jgi:hypothetical protein